MKKAFLSLAILGAISTQLFAVQVQDDDDKKKAEVEKFKADCKSSMVEAGQEAEFADVLCACFSEKMDKHFSYEELKDLNEGNIEKLDMEKVSNIQNYLQDCIPQ